MALATPYPTQLGFCGTRQIARWRPLVQWLLAIPHLLIAYALSMVRSVLTLISFFTVLCTGRIPRPLFDAIAMTFRYEWRAASYALFLHEDYPPFDFRVLRRADHRRISARASRLPGWCLSLQPARARLGTTLSVPRFGIARFLGRSIQK